MKAYLVRDENGNLKVIERLNSPPKNYIITLSDNSLIGKELKIIEVEETDELTKETILVKKAVVDETKQALKEQLEADKLAEEQAKQKAKDDLIKDIKLKASKKDMKLKELEDLVLKIIEHLGLK